MVLEPNFPWNCSSHHLPARKDVGLATKSHCTCFLFCKMEIITISTRHLKEGLTTLNSFSLPFLGSGSHRWCFVGLALLHDIFHSFHIFFSSLRKRHSSWKANFSWGWLGWPKFRWHHLVLVDQLHSPCECEAEKDSNCRSHCECCKTLVSKAKQSWEVWPLRN